jgi:hypothetical protein
MKATRVERKTKISLSILLIVVVAAMSSFTLVDLSQPSSSEQANATQLEKLLDESWATNGKYGYFTELGERPGQRRSLYDTAWWNHALTVNPKMGRPLDSDAVRRWLMPVLTESEKDTGDTAGMPTLAVLELSIVLATDLNIEFDPTIVLRRLETLRVGGRYRADTRMPEPTWSDTAVAVRILRILQVDVPDEVRIALDRELPNAIAVRDRSEVSKYVVPILSSLTTTQIQGHSPEIRIQIGWARQTLRSDTALARLAAFSALRSTLHAIGTGGPWPETCEGLPSGERGTEDDYSHDAHIFAQAIEAGCKTSVRPPPWTRSGWATPEARADAPQDSVNGARVAGHVKALAPYRTALRNQIFTRWLPEARTSPAQMLAIEMLMRILGESLSPVRPLKSEHVSQALAGKLDSSPLSILALATLQEQRIEGVKDVRPQRNLSGGPMTIFAVTQLELAYRLTGEVNQRESARSILRQLEISPGIYAASRGVPGVTQNEPSVVATAIAAWVNEVPLELKALTKSGLCNVASYCSAPESDSNLGLDTPLRATAAAVAAATVRPTSFPIPV